MGVGFAGAAAAEPSAEAREALRVCGTVSGAPDGLRAEIAAHGLALAEQAIAAHPEDPAAHLAAFCNLGKQMRLSSNPFGNLLRLRRLRKEVDATLSLDPECAGALVGKGRLLTELPGWLGGDRAQAEDLLRRGLAVDPDQVEGRIALAGLLRTRDPQAARVEARRALASAERDGDPDDIAAARDLLRSLDEDGIIVARERAPSTQGPIEPSK